MSSVFDSSDMNVDFDLTDLSPEDVASRGGGVDEECKAHLYVQKAQLFNEAGKVPNIRVDFKVMAADKKNQIGKVCFHRVYLGTKDKETKQPGPMSEDTRKIVARFALGMELISEADFGKPGKIPFHMLEGRQCCAHIKKEQRKDQDTGEKLKDQFDYRIPYGDVYPVHHESVADYPKDPELLAMSRLAGSNGAATSVDDV